MTSPDQPSSQTLQHAHAVPLYVDLEGGLLRTSLLLETLLAAIRHRPHIILALPFWALRGREHLQARLSAIARPSAVNMPCHDRLLEQLKAQHAEGRKVVLVTRDPQFAMDFAGHTGLPDSTLVIDAATAASGTARARLIATEARGEFAYAGRLARDLPVWDAARSGILVAAEPAVEAQARKSADIEQEITRRPVTARSYLKATRIYQWLKNVLIFVPMLTSHLWLDADAWANAINALVAFSLCASSIYILNDLFDLASDRSHPRKRNRPFASGAIPIAHGLMLAPVLLVAGLVAAALGGAGLLTVTAAYVVITTLYSLFLKTFVLADVITLAGLYTIRVIAGAIAIGVDVSFWLLAFSMSLFVSLALIKRCAELMVLGSLNRSKSSGRDYRVEDRPVLQSMGVASGFSAVLVLALFINDPDTIAAYAHPQLLWLVCCTMLYWITRMWIKTARGEMHDDPLLYAARDWNSLAVLALTVGLVLVAQG